MNKIFEESTPHVREKILSSPIFLTSLRIAIPSTAQDQFGESNASLDLISAPCKFKDYFIDHTAELKEKANMNTIKTHITGPINALIEHVNKMAIAQKALMDRTSNRICKLEAKIEKMEQNLDESIYVKIEDAFQRRRRIRIENPGRS